METILWSAALVKRELPNVRVRVRKGIILTGRVTGRLNEFATVSVTNERPAPGAPLWLDWQFSWETIAGALNAGRPLQV